jgi:DNA-binding transcriptional MerR regulator
MVEEIDMERELISKKDLLELTGISYGQLYRWKRKQLIPEHWFIRKSTFTGQETFFPKDMMLSRIDKILQMKDDLSLDQVAGKLSSVLIDHEMRKIELIKHNIISQQSLLHFARQDPDDTVYDFERIFYFYLADQMLRMGEISVEEGNRLIQLLAEQFPKFEDRPCELVLVRKMGVLFFTLMSSPAELYVENGVKVVARMSFQSSIEQLKAL